MHRGSAFPPTSGALLALALACLFFSPAFAAGAGAQPGETMLEVDPGSPTICAGIGSHFSGLRGCRGGPAGSTASRQPISAANLNMPPRISRASLRVGRLPPMWQR